LKKRHHLVMTVKQSRTFLFRCFTCAIYKLVFRCYSREDSSDIASMEESVMDITLQDSALPGVYDNLPHLKFVYLFIFRYNFYFSSQGALLP
jgi:hypothetical protein